jgi:phage-related protein
MGESGGAAAESFFKRMGEGGPAANKLMADIQKGGRRSDAMLKEMGLSLADLGGKAAVAKMSADQLSGAIAKALTKKGAGPLADMGLTMESILTKAQEGFRSLFDNLAPAVRPFMGSLKQLGALFGKTGAVTKALRPIMTAVLGGVFGLATRAVTAIRGIIVWLTKGKGASGLFGGAIGVFKGAWSALVAVFGRVRAALAPLIARIGGFAKSGSGMKILSTIFKGIAVAIVAVVAVVGIAVTVWGVFLGIVYGVTGAVIAFAAYLVGSVADAVGGAGDAVSGIIDTIGGLASAALDAGGNFVSGLVTGIENGVGAAVTAAKNLGSAVKGALQNLLGIHSDSTVTKGFGGNFTGGFAGGIDDGAPQVERSAARVGARAAEGTAGGMRGGGKGGSRGGVTINGGVHLHAAPGTTAQQVEEMWAMFAERLALSQGVAVGP